MGHPARLGLRQIQWGAVWRGASTSGAIALTAGLGVGSWIPESSNLSVLITAVISCGFIAGGAVAGLNGAQMPLLHGAASALPVAALAVAIQVVRWATERNPVGWIALLFLTGLTVSLSTLGAVLGNRTVARRRSLLRRDRARSTMRRSRP